MQRSRLRPFVVTSVPGALAAVFAVSACGTKPAPSSTSGPVTAEAPVVPTVSATQKQLAALAPAVPGPPSDAQKQLSQAIDQYFQRAQTRRLYVHLDKPVYQPGETIWLRVWELATPSLGAQPGDRGITAQLVSPKGAVVLQKRIRVEAGVATNDFELPSTVQGGEYIVRVASDLGGSFDRKLIVSTYQPPRIKKKLEFLRKAYGAGDDVVAALKLSRATGEPLASRDATAIVTVDEAEVARFRARTDAAGATAVKFQLPAQIRRGDGLLTVLVEDGGVTESIQKRIPILVKELDFRLFPEGGDLVAGLPGRVYFSAKNPIGKPADVEGRVVDADGAEVARFRSFHDGMGRFDLTPGTNAIYFVEITKPAGITQRIPVPAARGTGCSMQAVDDALNEHANVRVGIWCTEPRTVVVTGVLREKRLGDVAVPVAAGAPTVVALPMPAGSQGAVRVTAFDDDLAPLAERLIYRGRGADMKVSIVPDRKSYAPRDKVTLTVEAKDLSGAPVQADLSLAVADDTVLSFADDKTAHLLARVYLESEMPGQKIEEPNFYFSDKPKAPHAIDLVVGTQGWRRFAWQQVLAPLPTTETTKTKVYDDFGGDRIEGALKRPKGRVVVRKQQIRVRAGARRVQAEEAPPRPTPPPDAKPAAPRPRPNLAKADKPMEPMAQPAARGPRQAARRMPRRPEPRPDPAGMDGEMGGGEALELETDEDWDDVAADANRWAWAPVREFPVPNYAARYDGPRNDFRETIYWKPSVVTGRDGKAEVSFYLSDGITSFRAIAEGVSKGGLPGRGDALVQSKLPVSLAVKMPLEVSAGDRIQLPVSLANETDRPYTVQVASTFGPAFRVRGGVPGTVKLDAKQRRSFFAELEVVGDGRRSEDGNIAIAIDTANLKDEVTKTVKVVPLGFPQEVSISGTLEQVARHEVVLASALPRSIDASISLYPSPLATMIQGTQAIIREPHGCFEQASSANYPNIMVLGYLEQHDAADPDLVSRTTGMLDRGYKKLVGYESPKKGYEWFGGDPGHEALTAYGLMEFADMTAVYGDVDRAMIQRTAAWLKSRRDGKGGYQRNKRALDSFGRASEQVTNGYITYALAEAGEKDLAAELAYQKNLAGSTKDPYLMAMAANTMALLEPKAASTAAALDRLAGMQGEDGGFTGANHSITRSGGAALTIETTSLAAMALIRGDRARGPVVRKAIDWLNNNRNGFGGYGSTQSTVLALKAMTRYADATRATQSGGEVILLVNGVQAGQVSFDKGRKDPIVLEDVAGALRPGKNTIELRLRSATPLPYSAAFTYRSRVPASSPETKVSVATSLAKSEVPMGEGVRMKVRVRNVTDEGVPMTLARVGLPGGLAFQTWQLKELRDKRVIDFYETREREVILYFRSLAPKADTTVDLDLIARVPGTYVAPASRAYLYYTDEFKHWIEPVRVTVRK